jgi:hypothetical protein
VGQNQIPQVKLHAGILIISKDNILDLLGIPANGATILDVQNTKNREKTHISILVMSGDFPPSPQGEVLYYTVKIKEGGQYEGFELAEKPE